MCLKDDKKPQQAEVEGGPATTTTTTSSATTTTKSETSATGESDIKAMSPDIMQDISDLDNGWIVLIVRDLSSAISSIPKETFFLSTVSTVTNFFSSVSKIFRYEVNSFALTYQRSNGEQVELNDMPPEKSLGEIGFTVGAANWNNLILTNLHGSQPRKIEDDDLSLGASASPTSSVSERKMWYDTSLSGSAGEASACEASACEASAEATPTSSSRIKHDIGSVGYVGLVNQAMTCYLNSLLQTLFMTPEFRNALYRWEFKGTEEEATKNIPYQLQRLFLQLQTATRTAVETTNLTKSFGWDSSEVWQQHDIQELYRVMFDALEQCFKNTDQAELINNLYEGKMKDYVKCLECATENAREDSFLDIPLPIRPFGSNTAYKSVEEALRMFVEPELLTGNNKYECSKCNNHCDAHKGLKFTRFPYLLTLHLKRFDFDYQTFHRIKLNDKVTFPSILDLNGFIEENCKEATAYQQGGGTQASSPDKCATDKLDDASTTDSGSALDAEENSSVGFSASNQTSNDTDTQDEDEGIDVSSVYNEKNRLLCASNGPFVYELFSIMVHSGSASGGHYYAYIKDFKTGEWFCFNDQSVSRITIDDIRKTYGGSVRGYYSSWSSSANAYMLMYRQADKDRNADNFSESQYPAHIKDLVQRMVSEEAAEREAREIERHMCKIKLFCQHPNAKVIMEKKLKVHKDATLNEATKLAYQELMLEEVVPFERCRLVKYEEVHDSIECSFENVGDEPIYEVLGGVKSSYKFDLLMEIRDQDVEFQEYKPGGITVKVYLINLTTEEVEGPHTVRAGQTLNVREFKELLGRHFGKDPTKMRVVQERYCNDHKALLSDTKTLKDEGFYRSSKVYIEASGEEAPNFFIGSQMYSILDRYEHTITIYCNLPERSPEVLKALQIPPFIPKEQAKPSPKVVETAPPVETKSAAAETEEKAKELKDNKEPVTVETQSSKKSDVTNTEMTSATAVTSLSTATTVTPSLSDSSVSSSLPLVETSTTPSSTPLDTSSATTSATSATSSATTTATSSATLPTSLASSSATTSSASSDTSLTTSSSAPSATSSATSPATSSATSPSTPTASTKKKVTKVTKSTTKSPTKSPKKVTSTKSPKAAGTPTSVATPVSSSIPIPMPTPVSTSTTTSKPTPVTTSTPAKTPEAPSCATPKAALGASAATGATTPGSTAAPSTVGANISPGGATTAAPSSPAVTTAASSATVVNSLSDEDEWCVISSTANSDQSASEDSSLTSDSDRTLVGDPPEDNLSDHFPDYHNVSSPEDNPKATDQSDENGWGAPAHCTYDTGWGDNDDEKYHVKRYFRANMTEQDILRVSVDKRITIGQLKRELQKYVGVSEEHLKIYKYYINSNHEFECTRMTETLASCCDNNVMKIRLGRALQPGEFKGKVFLLDLNNSEEPAKFLIDFVIRKKEVVANVKRAIVKEVNAKCGLNLDVTKLRLRKKSWKNPQTIFLENHVFDDDIMLCTNWEYYLQDLYGPEQKTDRPGELSLFLKRWRPSSYTTEPLLEIILSIPTAEALKEKISQVAGLPLENVEFAKGKGTFPCDISVLDISADLDWSAKSGPLDKKPIYILDDGAVIYYRDSTESLKSLTESERNSLASEENSRLNRDYHSTVTSSSTVSSSRSREKGLKIYFNQSNNGSK